MNFYAILALCMLVCIGAAEFHGRAAGRAAERQEWEVKAAHAQASDLENLKNAVAAGSAIASNTLAAVSGKATSHTIDRGVIEREIRTDIRYVNDCMPESGRLLFNAISAGRPLMSAGATTGESDRIVSAGNGAASAQQPGRDTTSDAPSKP